VLPRAKVKGSQNIFYTSFSLDLRQDCWFQLFCFISYFILFCICFLSARCLLSVDLRKKLPSIEH